MASGCGYIDALSIYVKDTLINAHINDIIEEVKKQAQRIAKRYDTLDIFLTDNMQTLGELKMMVLQKERTNDTVPRLSILMHDMERKVADAKGRLDIIRSIIIHHEQQIQTLKNIHDTILHPLRDINQESLDTYDLVKTTLQECTPVDVTLINKTIEEIDRYIGEKKHHVSVIVRSGGGVKRDHKGKIVGDLTEPVKEEGGKKSRVLTKVVRIAKIKRTERSALAC